MKVKPRLLSMIDVLARFEKKYISEPNTGCWLWIGGCTGRGYGTMHLTNPRRMVGAHVVSYMLFRGDVPTGLDVRHTCDVVCCVNPEHLVLGTRKQNMADAKARGRHAHGSRCGQAKITEQDVINIRADKRSQSQIAKQYGLSQATVSVLINRKTWKHVP